MDTKELEKLGIRTKVDVERFRKAIEIGLQNNADTTETIEALNEIDAVIDKKSNEFDVKRKVWDLMKDLFGCFLNHEKYLPITITTISDNCKGTTELGDLFGITKWYVRKSNDDEVLTSMQCKDGVFNDLLGIDDVLHLHVDFWGNELGQYDELDNELLGSMHMRNLDFETAKTVLEKNKINFECCKQALELIGTDNFNKQQIEDRKVLAKHIFKCTINDEEWKQALMMAKLSDSAQALLDYCVNSSGKEK